MARQRDPDYNVEYGITEALRATTHSRKGAYIQTDLHKPPQAPDHAHYWVYLYDELWVCGTCNELRWIPDWDEAEAFSNLVRVQPFKKVYAKMIKGRDEECIIKLMEESTNEYT